MALSIAQKQNYLYAGMLFATFCASIAIYHLTEKKWLLFREGESYFENQKFKKAIELYKMSLAKGPTHPNILLHLADAYVAEGKFSEAIEWYRAYLQVFPHDTEARHSLAQTLGWNGEIYESEKEYKILLEEQKNEKLP